MKFGLFTLTIAATAAILCAGCNSTAPDLKPDTPQASALPQGTVKRGLKKADLVGKWDATPIFINDVPSAQRTSALQAAEGNVITLNENGTFNITSQGVVMNGAWDITHGKIQLTVKEANGTPIDKFIEKMVAQGADPATAHKMSDPRNFDLSEDGKQLVPSDHQGDIVPAFTKRASAR